MAQVTHNRLTDWDAAEAKREFELGRGRDQWVPGCGGSEVPALVHGAWFLYCFNHKQRRHAYLNMSTDMILSDEEAKLKGLG
jgi:hypothetical protein